MGKPEWSRIDVIYEDGMILTFHRQDIQRLKALEPILKAFNEARELKQRLDRFIPKRS